MDIVDRMSIELSSSQVIGLFSTLSHNHTFYTTEEIQLNNSCHKC